MRIDKSRQCTQVIFMVPNRARISQVWRQARDFASASGVTTQTLRPASDEDIKAVTKNRPHLVIGTPASVQQAITKGKLPVQGLSCVILDDVEKLLLAPTAAQVKSALKLVTPCVQLCALSGERERNIDDVRLNLGLTARALLPARQPLAAKSSGGVRWCDMDDDDDDSLKDMAAQFGFA